MAGIIIQAEIAARNYFEHSAPDFRCRCQVLPSRPLCLVKKHRTVFDCHSYLVFLREADNIRPDFLKKLQILFHALCMITADKGSNHASLLLSLV